MQKKFIILLIILILMIVIFNSISKNNDNSTNFKPLEIDVGDVFDSLDYESEMQVLNYAIGDVTNDSKNDMILAIGNQDQVVDVVIYDPSGDKFIKGNIKKCIGINPRITIANVDEASNNEIILITENEDKSKNVKILTIVNNESKELFKPRDNNGLVITGYFMDGFKAYISIRKLKLERYIDLSDYKDNYIKYGLYDADGRLLIPNQKLSVSNFISVELIPLSDQCGLKTIQRIKGFDELVETKYKDIFGNILKELNGEKIDLILYDKDPKVFIANAMSPAKNVIVNINDEVKKQALVIVTDDNIN